MEKSYPFAREGIDEEDGVFQGGEEDRFAVGTELHARPLYWVGVHNMEGGKGSLGERIRFRVVVKQSCKPVPYHSFASRRVLQHCWRWR